MQATSVNKDICAAMVTVDRSPNPNYLRGTLLSLLNSDLSTCPRLDSLVIVDSGPKYQFANDTVKSLPSHSHNLYVSGPIHAGRRPPNRNVAAALRMGLDSCKWLLFLEDDIEVGPDFFSSVGAWLDDNAREDRRVYSFGANYPDIDTQCRLGAACWDYPIDKFYGTQCFAIRTPDALSLASYLDMDHPCPGTYDLMMHEWAKREYPHINYFLASCPSFVQHVGNESYIRKGGESFQFSSFDPRYTYLQDRAKLDRLKGLLNHIGNEIDKKEATA